MNYLRRTVIFSVIIICLGVFAPLQVFSQTRKEINIFQNKSGLVKVRGCTLEAIRFNDDSIDLNKTSLSGISCLIDGDSSIECYRENEEIEFPVYQKSTCRPGLTEDVCRNSENGRRRVYFPKITGSARLLAINAINTYATKCKNATVEDYAKFQNEYARMGVRREHQSSQGQNRIENDDGRIVNGTCASGKSFNGIYDASDGRWMFNGGRNGITFSNNKNDGVNAVCH